MCVCALEHKFWHRLTDGNAEVPIGEQQDYEWEEGNGVEAQGGEEEEEERDNWRTKKTRELPDERLREKSKERSRERSQDRHGDRSRERERLKVRDRSRDRERHHRDRSQERKSRERQRSLSPPKRR